MFRRFNVSCQLGGVHTVKSKFVYIPGGGWENDIGMGDFDKRHNMQVTKTQEYWKWRIGG